MTSESQKQAMKKYLASNKGRLAKKRAQDKYNNSIKGRASRRNYQASSKGHEATARSNRRREIMN